MGTSSIDDYYPDPFRGGLEKEAAQTGHPVTQKVPPPSVLRTKEPQEERLPCQCPYYKPGGTGILVTFDPRKRFLRYTCENGHEFGQWGSAGGL